MPYLRTGAVKIPTEEEMLEDYLKVRGIGDLVAAGTVLVVVTMVAHYWGYALYVGWQVLSYFTAQDYIRLSTLWLPAVPVFAFLLLFEKIRRRAAKKRFVQRLLTKTELTKVRDPYLTSPGPVDIEGLVQKLQTQETIEDKSRRARKEDIVRSALRPLIYQVPRRLRKSPALSTRYILRKKFVGDREPTELDGWIIALCVTAYTMLLALGLFVDVKTSFSLSFIVISIIVINRSSWYNISSSESHLIYKVAPVVMIPFYWVPKIAMMHIHGINSFDIMFLAVTTSYWLYGIAWLFKVRIPLLQRVGNIIYNTGATAIALLVFAFGFGFYSAHLSVTKEGPSVAVHVNYQDEPIEGNILINLSNTLLISPPGSKNYTAISQGEIRSIERLRD